MNNIQKAFKYKAGLRLADGGMVNKVMGAVGLRSPAERMRDSVADQNAKQAAYEAQKATPVAAPAPQPAPQAAPTGLRGYAAGSDIEGRLKAAGMAHGGAVRGPGTGTSDSIPAMLSKGEYVLPADTVRHVGKENLDAIKDATHMPVGLRAPSHFADGGSLSDDAFKRLRTAFDGDGNGIRLEGERAAPLRAPRSYVPPPLPQTPWVPPPLPTEMPPQVNPTSAAPVPSGVSAAAAGREAFNSARASTLDRGDAAAAANAARPAPAPAPAAAEAPAGYKTGMRSANLGPGAANGYAPFDAARSKLANVGEALAGSKLLNNFVTNNAVTRGLAKTAGRVAPVLGAGIEGKEAYDDAQNGDYLPAAGHGVAAAANIGGLFNPLAAAYAVGHGGGGLAYNNASEDTQNAIGGTINQGLRNVGKLFGADLGVDDSAMNQFNAGFKKGPSSAGASVGPTDEDDRTQLMTDTRAKSTNLPGFNGLRRVDVAGQSPLLTNLDDAGNPIAGSQVAQGTPYDVAAMNRTSQIQRELADAKIAAMDGANPGLGGGMLGGGSFGQDLRTKTDGGQRVSGVTLQNRTAMAQNQAGLRNALMQDATTRRSQDVTRDDNLRTVAASTYGHELTAQNARAANLLAVKTAQLAQRNKEHEFAQKDKEFGLQNEKNNFEVQTKGRKDLEDQLGTIFPGADGKPDAARVGSASKAIHDELGAQIQDAKKRFPPGSPGYAKAQQHIAELSAKGVGALDDAEKRTMISQAAIKDRLLATKGIFLGGSTPMDTRLSGYEVDNSPEAVEKGKRLFGSDTVTLKNGAMIRANDLKFTEPGSNLANWWKVPTDQFDAGLKGNR